ncbi:MAG: hypothetical protein KC546_07815 [Anaerolineae bacterium]|nr:hypothetical protein [Anaerolineae bacterium]
MTNLAVFLGTFGWLAVGAALVIVARLSLRLGTVTHARPYYRLMDLAAVMICIGALGSLALEWSSLAQDDQLAHNMLSMLCDTLVAVGISLGLGVAWYYWSWLLAERD